MLYVPRNRVVRYNLLPMVVLLLSLGVVSCGQTTAGRSPTPAPRPTATPTPQPSLTAVTITAVDFSYDIPQPMPSGLIDITFVNNGTQIHMAQLVQLNSGVTYDQFHSALLQQGLLVMRTLGSLMGGPNVTAPGQSSEVILNLPPGQYIALSPVPATDGVRQYLKGMIAQFTVSAQPIPNLAPAPNPTVLVTLRSFSIGPLPNIAAGTVIWQVSNIGQEPYEFSVVQLLTGKTEQDVSAFLLHPSGPPPFVNIGGMASVSPGFYGWVKLSLLIGKYVALSQVLDQATGKPDFALGMITSFSVQ